MADGRISATKDVVSCEFGNGIALLDLKSNVYFSLNSVSTFVWELIQTPRSPAEICKAVMERYDVGTAQCRADLAVLLKDLTDAGLVKRHDEEIV
jgi:hypothetical protein